MPKEVQITLADMADGASPPAWAEGDQSDNPFWYFVDEHGEQWVARRLGDEVVFSGDDIDWQELWVTSHEARRALQPSAELLERGFHVLVLKDTILNNAEALWVAAVLRAAFP